MTNREEIIQNVINEPSFVQTYYALKILQFMKEKQVRRLLCRPKTP